LKMELIEGSETSANHNQTPGKYPKEYIQHVPFANGGSTRLMQTWPHEPAMCLQHSKIHETRYSTVNVVHSVPDSTGYYGRWRPLFNPL